MGEQRWGLREVTWLPVKGGNQDSVGVLWTRSRGHWGPELQACRWGHGNPQCTTDDLQSLAQSLLVIALPPRVEVRASASSLGLACYISHFWMRGTLWRIFSQHLLPMGFLKGVSGLVAGPSLLCNPLAQADSKPVLSSEAEK